MQLSGGATACGAGRQGAGEHEEASGLAYCVSNGPQTAVIISFCILYAAAACGRWIARRLVAPPGLLGLGAAGLVGEERH